MRKFSSLLVGENALLVQCAETLLRDGGSIVAIATESVVVRDWAVGRDIVVIDSGADLASRIVPFEYDWLFSIGYLRMLPDSVWGRARCGAVNFHDGELPELAGLNTPSWSLLEGRPMHGVTWHEITSGVDEGDILAAQAFETSPDETVLTLNAKCFEAGISTFTQLTQNIAAGTMPRSRQDLSRRSYYARNSRPPAAGTLCFSEPAERLSRLVRALSFGHGYANPLVTPKVLTSSGPYTVSALTIVDEGVAARPGEVIAIRDKGAVIATADAAVLIEASALTSNGVMPISDAVRPGDLLPLLDEDWRATLGVALSRVLPHEHVFRKWIARAQDIDLDGIGRADATAEPRYGSIPLRLPEGSTPEERAGLALAYLARISGQPAFDVAFTNDDLLAFCDAHRGYFAQTVPLRVEVGQDSGAGLFLAEMAEAIAEAGRRLTYPADLIERTPNLVVPHLSVGLRLTAKPEQAGAISGCALTFVIADGENRLVYDPARLSGDRAREIASRLDICASLLDRQAPLSAMPVMTDVELQKVLYDLNRTERTYDSTICIHDLVKRQSALTPDAIAVSFRGSGITYRELENRSDRIANALVARGAGPDVIIGLHLPRGIDLVVGAYAILKSGGAYLPLDPAFPSNRLKLMVEDSATELVVTSHALDGNLAGGPARFVCIEDLARETNATAETRNHTVSQNLAYVIYTSGSTGRPKGVMVEHRNVVNFFAGMDDLIPRSQDRQDAWLAVTSLSFDISVLEIFWTLSRGFKVVVHSSELDHAKLAKAKLSTPMDFSLFYWGNDDGVGPEKYRTLLDGARFADSNGFQAIWTPERHFHAFGGPYPNPAVTGAAVAAVTRNLAIRAGSCVLPLHHPARVAEEWAVVDNLSNGRVGIAFASGWMPEDFVLRPENAPPNNKAALLRDIETVRKLWRGETVTFEYGAGKVDVVTQPRPMSKELPVWVTTAGNPDTYRDAARLGAHVLTHLLGQSIDELAEKIRIYRKALEEAGRNPADYKVTVMLHTLVGSDREQVRGLARGPMKEYLRSAAALIKQYAWAFPAFKKPSGIANPMEIDLQTLSSDEMDAILEFAFERYFEDSGLFGTVEDAVARVEQLDAIGVDEIACLIDFGLPSQTVLDALTPLAQVVSSSRTVGVADSIHHSLATDIHREGVTHLQCTPSMASMFLGDPEDHSALRQVRHLFIGGEPLKRSLVSELRQATSATVENMYGPTETTIWSSTVRATTSGDVVPLGIPIANTQFYVLDKFSQPVPPGTPGELYIGGDGVTRGYLNRDELTRERFLPNPFADGHIYRTGDLVRLAKDDSFEFIGRTDNQVKIRGNRIELGEIEARIAAFPGVCDAVVTVREDRPGDKSVVAYLRATSSVPIDALRNYLATELPEYMIPSHYVLLDAFPLTPNAKVDRAKLPKPDAKAVLIETNIDDDRAIHGEFESVIADAFQRTLGLPRVGRHDNFFALGGHSLLAVQMHRELKAGAAPALTITDLFRFPTVAGLANHIAGRADTGRQLDKVAERAAARRAALETRRSAFARTSISA
ncbi:LLM class flavin-dependent oxidoreductase [Mesorhizobium sp. AR10]|uniref:MupA/Atu3671 family FMN-dependent luciferase-like monooxygenase n=1 Tax=Mesorhizobium sp. AR10 TaxID=2865839 RepID=UPI00215EAB3F|nr:MupA/Atu3671 family FMN-dependent luciferase-like monooxygenase [Mesorhizobium sp. AR10]UVK40220.1 LLM class flavin-dependent oxidoreductase [Mesorhizobium sp. AR10]